MGTLYDSDYFAWTREQADALERRSANDDADLPKSSPFTLEEVMTLPVRYEAPQRRSRTRKTNG